MLRRGSLFIVAALLAAIGPAPAQTPGTVPTSLPRPVPSTAPTAKPSAALTPCQAVDKMRQAMAAARSYRSVAQLTGIGLGWPVQKEFVAPDRLHETTTATMNGMTVISETITIGPDIWSKRPRTGWMKVPRNAATGDSIVRGQAVSGPPTAMAALSEVPQTPCSAATDLGMADDAHVYEVEANGTKIRYYLRPDFLPAKVVQTGAKFTGTETYSDWNTDIVIGPPV